ncbi:hypothetical protein HRbin25_00538 [bacterium HR25]|nr:hypothetical protein HRbin25_00538 [bacterium HR25]
MTLATSAAPRQGAREPYRPFTLTVDLQVPRIVISYRHPSANGRGTERLVALEGTRAKAVLPTLLELLHGAGYSLPRLEERGRGRYRLGEGLGARIVLLLWALGPIQKPSRASLVRTGVLAMVDEEVLYWYAKAAGERTVPVHRHQNALKALRVLLAGE